MKKRISILVLSISLISFGGYAQHAQTTEKSTKTEKPDSKTNPEFQKQLEVVYKTNIKLNDAFVESDAEKVKAAVKPVKDAISKVNVNLLKDNVQKAWTTYATDLNQSLERIENAENIKEQRKQFATFNETLYKGIKEFGIGGEAVYFQHCPMALNNEGASWLSDTTEIRNPYYGEKMLKCGVVKEIL